MAVYRGIVQDGRLIRSNNAQITVISSNDWTVIAFPKDVSQAYVQATNRFIGDRLKLGALTVWSDDQEPKQLMFENANGNGKGKWLCFSVKTK